MLVEEEGSSLRFFESSCCEQDGFVIQLVFVRWTPHLIVVEPHMASLALHES